MPSEIDGVKDKMKTTFEMSDLGTLSYFLGLEFVQTPHGMLLHQKTFCEILNKFNIMSCNPTPLPVMANLKVTEEVNEMAVDATLFKEIVGSLKYLCISIPDISYGVGLISRFMNNFRAPHMTTTKHILGYIKGTYDFG